MHNWEQWAKISDGPYQGTPKLSPADIVALEFVIDILDQDGNVIKFMPAAPGMTGAIINTGGPGNFTHLPSGFGIVATGSDQCLYLSDYDGNSFTWTKVAGPGRFLSGVESWASMDGSAEIIGEGLEHQLAYTFLAPGQDRRNIQQWDNLGQPGKPGGPKGIKGRPAPIRDGNGMHVLARGQDNRLWHIFGKSEDPMPGKLSFGSWTSLGGGLSNVPVVSHTANGIECYVVGERKELQAKAWDGRQWGGYQDLGGQLKGLPAPVSVYDSDSTFVFARGVNDELWYRHRTGGDWQSWQKMGDGITGDPAVWGARNGDDITITCVVLRERGELWQRVLRIKA